MQFEFSFWDSEMIGSLGILFFALLGSLMFLAQAFKVWRARSGQGISVIWIIYFFFIYVVTVIYGFYLDKMVVIVHAGLRLLTCLPLLFLLWKFKGFTNKEWSSLVFFAGLILLILLVPAMDIYVLLFSLGMIYTAVKQLIELKNNPDRGDLHVGLIIVFLSANVFWLIFGLAILNFVFIIVSGSLFIIYLLVFITWLFKPAKNRFV